MPLRLIKASWLNRVANLWNYMRGGRCINVTVPDNPSPESGVRVDLDMKALEDELARRGFAKQSDLTVDVLAARTTLPQDEVAPEDWDKDDGTGEGEEHSTTTNGATTRFYPAAGSSKKAARADHRHKSNLVPLENSTASNRPRGLSTNNIGVIGTSKMAARADHKHPRPYAYEIIFGNTTVGAALDNALTFPNGIQEAACFVTTNVDGEVIQYPNTEASGGMAIGDVNKAANKLAKDVNFASSAPSSAPGTINAVRGWVRMLYCVTMEPPQADPTDGDYLTVYTVERYYHNGLLTDAMQNGIRHHPVDGSTSVANVSLPPL